MTAYGGGMAFGPLIMVLVWIMVIGAVVIALAAVFRDRTPRPAARETTETEDVLKERYARGGISAEEFERRRRGLRRS